MKKIIVILLFIWLLTAFQKDIAQAQEKSFTNSLGIEFVLIPAGTFTNSWVTEDDFGEKVTHQRTVTISQPFYLGKYEVTQEQWLTLMGNNPAKYKGQNNPVEYVSWDDVQIFIQKLNQKEGGWNYRLPTEAEWEHAARAGSDTEWSFGDNSDNLGQYAWFILNSQNKTHPVGEKQPNPFGLYDIYGNISEWIQDYYDHERPGTIGTRQPEGWYWYKEETVSHPSGPSSGTARVMRGGHRGDRNEVCSSIYRMAVAPDARTQVGGFRLAFTPEQLSELQAQSVNAQAKSATNGVELPARASQAQEPAVSGGGQIPAGVRKAQDKTFTNSLGMEFVLIPKGKFTNYWEIYEKSKKFQHQRGMTISQPFYLGKYEVTQEQWVAVMGGGSKPTQKSQATNPSHKKGRVLPVSNVSWDKVQIFIQKLNQMESGGQYRLPTEAEWEYAARAGTNTKWFFGDSQINLERYSWFGEKVQGRIHPVGEKQPNPWGLYDIYGNVAELVPDWHVLAPRIESQTNTRGEWVKYWEIESFSRGSWYEPGEVIDPTGPAKETNRVVRGGSFRDDAEMCSSTKHDFGQATGNGDNIGFRLVFMPTQ